MFKMYIIGLLVAFTVVDARPQLSLEYQPMRPPHHPKPSGTYPSQIIPPGKPWPDSEDGYQNFSQVPTIVDRIKETQQPSSSTSSSGFLWPFNIEDEEDEVTKQPLNTPVTTNKITLEYKPTRPPHHPKPGDNIQPIVPPGEPWPAGPEQYPTTNTPVIVDRIKEDSVQESTPATQKQTPINLGYKPTRPFYHPNPGNNINQIVPPGKPWPDSPEGYQNLSQVGNSPSLINRIKESTSSSKMTTTKSPTINLEYQPNRPSFHPNPGNNINQIVPPGQPWPSSPEGYQNFSQVGDSPNLVNRGQEISSVGTEPSSTQATNSNKVQPQRPISLEYQPNRPFFHPNPGNKINQIVPPGEAWPDSPEGYKNFSQILPVPNLLERIKEAEESSTKQTTTTHTQSPTALEYSSLPPSFHPNPGDTLGELLLPKQPGSDSPQRYQNFSQFTPLPDLLDRLKDFVEKKKAIEKTTKPTESGFVWETETNSEQNLPKTRRFEAEITRSTEYFEEPSIKEIDSTETSMTDTDINTSTTGISYEQRLYTSAPLKEKNEEDKIS